MGEPPVLAVAGLAQLPVLARAEVVARRPHRVQLPLLAWRPVLAKAHLPVLAGLRVLAHLGVEAAAPPHLLSRQSFAAAMARSSP